MPGCHEAGEYRAPKSRTSLNDYYWFCLEHVRTYNAGWDFYKGMSPAEVEAQIRADMVGQRPTWPLGSLGHTAWDEDELKDPLHILNVFGLGLATAIFVDATVVRMVLVPAVMQPLGSASWWLPGWIGRAIPSRTIEPDVDHRAGGGLIRPHPVSAAPAE